MIETKNRVSNEMRISTLSSRFSTLGVWAFIASLVVCIGISFVGAASFDEQRKVVAVAPEKQSEALILALLKAGIEEGKPVLAIAETQKWLRQNLPEDAMLLYYAGRAAELSGDWKGAVALYQQYLKKADLKSATADEAVYAVYTLLLERLNNTAGAYAFSKNEGDRLLVCPRARQFDKGFMDEAIRRLDYVAVVNRLRACIEAGLPEDLLIARYDNYFRWLLGRVSGGGGFRRDAQVSQELVDACKAVASVITFDEELKLYLDWAVSVRFYVQQKLAEKDVAPPIAEAEVLLAKYPKYAIEVQLGWAGGTKDNHSNHGGETKLYWEHELDAKLAPVVAAAARLTVTERADLFSSWQPSGYWREPHRLNLNKVKAISDYLKSNPKLVQASTYASPLTKGWNKYTPEEALAIAPQIQKNRHIDASLVRAIAAGTTKKTVKDGDKTRTEYGRDLDKMMVALRGPEAWRFTAGNFNGSMSDQLWHYCGRPGGNQKRDAEIAKSKEFGKRLVSKLVAKDAPANQRIAEFRKLWNDYKAPQPKISGVSGSLKTVLQFTPEVIPELLKDPNSEAQILARNAIASGMSGPDPLWKETIPQVNVNSYAPIINELARRHTRSNIANLKTQYPLKFKPHPLEAAMRKQLSASLKQNKLAAWQVMAWINMQCPEGNEEQVKLIQAMQKSSAWKTMPFEVKFAAREWFEKDALTPGQIAWIDAGDPAIVCKDLLSLTNVADVATTAAVLSKAIDGVKKSPVKIHIQGLDQLAAVTNTVFTDAAVFDQVLEVTDNLRESVRADAFGSRLLALAQKERDPVMMHRTAFYLWQRGRTDPRGGFGPNAQFVESLLDESPATVLTMARIGLRLFKGLRSYGFDPQKAEANLKAIAGKASMALGLVTIPVPRNHPAYPIYKSQADWMTAKEDTAWTMLQENWDQLLPIHRELSIEYLNWVLQRVIYSRDEDRQEELVKALLAWSGEVSTPISLTQRIELEIAYGDIALQRGMLPEAHAIFVKIQNNKAYSGLPVVHQATLRRAMTERISKNFDAALNTLNELDMQRVPAMWAATRYARAEVYFDMEEYDDATEQIDAILQRMPNHAEAKLMGGKLFIARRRWMEASELDIGPEGEENTLVPGEMLKVTLNDHTLAVSGAGTEIEVAVWTTSGDKERFLLRQFGDVKTKFRGEVLTELGPPAPEDRILQLVGDDEIYFAYSERFRKKMNNMAEKRGGPITVASDAMLMASARVLLSESEQLVADRERLNEILEDKDGMRADRLDTKTLEAYNAQIKAANERRMIMTRVKPGNPIHVRVIDPDRSRTKDVDQLEVGIESSSGDSIGRVTLKETGTHTGWFEGSVPTAGAQAMAFANSSEPGRNPNMVISSTPGYPAWRPVGEKGETPEFKVDLNDNVKLGELKISAKENGSKLKKFILQTGMNDKSMEVVAVYPVNTMSLKHPWQPSVTVINDTDHHHARNERLVYDLRELEEHLARGWITQIYAQGVVTNVVGVSEAMPASITKAVDWKRQNHHKISHVIYRFRGYFYEPSNVTRRFKVDLGKYMIPKKTHPSVNHPAQFLLAVDGRIITDKEKMDKLEGEINLKSGLHRFEIWATGWSGSIGFGRTMKLQSNLDDDDGLVDCPDNFFNPESFPQGTLAHRNAPAAITANADGSEYTVKFAPDSRGRLLNLVFLEQDGPLPALNKLTLTSSDGAKVLPVEEDYAKLNKNETLEILTGDKVAVRYVDDRFVSKSKQKLERFLHVSFTSARMQFEFFEMRKNRGGEDEEYFEKKLRFIHGKPMILTINDADMDVSPEPDKVFCTIENKSGDKSRFEAVESGPSTGIFRLTITPVEGAPANKLQIQAAKGDTLQAVYRDEENMVPGVPIDRVATIVHAAYSTPVLNLAHATVTAIDPKELPAADGLQEGFYKMDPEEYHSMSFAERHEWSKSHGNVQARWLIKSKMLPAATPPTNGFKVVDGRHMYLEVVAPHLALRKGSSVKVYVQTDAGRKLFKSNRAGSASPLFDINVPGTVELGAILSMLQTGHRDDRWRLTPQIATYLEEKPRRDETAKDMRFTCEIPLVAGVLPEYGVLDRAEKKELAKLYLLNTEGLVVRAGERVHVGFRYEDEKGVEQWLTASSKVKTHPVLDLMQEGYRAGMRQVFVGENLYPRVVDLGADKTDQPDKVRVLLQAKSGAKHFVDLTESGIHTGVFKAIFATTYADTPAKSGASTKAYDVRRQGFPVVYGDDIGARYTDASGFKTPVPLVKLGKGSDGTVTPFSKKYEDSDTAMKTQFALAESYLELAKRHRKMGETIIAKVEFERAKQLLANAISRFNDPETRANAEYLLGNLTMEEADTSKDADLKKRRYHAALARFMTVTSTYQDTLYASMAQFKIAVTYERLSEPDIAAQEYVKLAYKYPESQHLAVSMLRLGTHFQRKAYKFELKANALLKKIDDKDAQHEGKAMRIISNREYIKSANIFGRLQLRFPGHEHAGKAGLKAGQAYMRAGETRDALATFRRVVANEGYDGKTVRSQAMYWIGMCYQKLNDQMAAFSIYKRLTYDFPESKWASYANGQLQQESLLKIGDEIEMKQLEAEGER